MVQEAIEDGSGGGHVTAGTDAEASPNVIRPDDSAAGSNEEVWQLASIW